MLLVNCISGIQCLQNITLTVCHGPPPHDDLKVHLQVHIISVSIYNRYEYDLLPGIISKYYEYSTPFQYW